MGNWPNTKWQPKISHLLRIKLKSNYQMQIIRHPDQEKWKSNTPTSSDYDNWGLSVQIPSPMVPSIVHKRFIHRIYGACSSRIYKMLTHWRQVEENIRHKSRKTSIQTFSEDLYISHKMNGEIHYSSLQGLSKHNVYLYQTVSSRILILKLNPYRSKLWIKIEQLSVCYRIQSDVMLMMPWTYWHISTKIR